MNKIDGTIERRESKPKEVWQKILYKRIKIYFYNLQENGVYLICELFFLYLNIISKVELCKSSKIMLINISIISVIFI